MELIHIAESNTDTENSWQNDGFLVVRDLVPHYDIDQLVNEFRHNILHSNLALKRQPNFKTESGTRQYPHAYDKEHSLTREGYMREGLKDAHALSESHPVFSAMILNILCSKRVQDALSAINGAYNHYTLHQSMLFDFNPGTEPHQDSYYIDSEPRGAMVGFWLALEDIEHDAGRFYIIKESHIDSPAVNVFLKQQNSEYLSNLQMYFEKNKDRVFAPCLKKGDAIFWGGQVVHGSFPNINPAFSRKSLTAHYIPCELMGRNSLRVFEQNEERITLGMQYVVTNKPDISRCQMITKHEKQILIDDKPVKLTVIRTECGNQVVIT